MLLTSVPAYLAVVVVLVQLVVVDVPLTLLTLWWPILSPSCFALAAACAVLTVEVVSPVRVLHLPVLTTTRA